MNDLRPSTPLSHILPPLVLGGAGFSHQVYRNPNATQVLKVLKRAFELGLCAIDTSAYYHPSEILLGEALSHPEIEAQYPRDKYLLMTKVGRITATKFDYSPAWVRRSVLRSLQRLRTKYLDVVFCHDIEFVPEQEVMEAIGTLLEMAREGLIKYIGVSGYRIDLLVRVARRVQNEFGRPLDIVQNWAQMTLQNDRLAREGLAAFQKAGVSCVCNASPLAIGLLRANEVPVGDLGDFHPAPLGLRIAVKKAADYLHQVGESMAELALRHSIRRGQSFSSPDFRITTIMGITSVAEVDENLRAAQQVLQVSSGPRWLWNHESTGPGDREIRRAKDDQLLCREVHRILGEWLDYCFPSPGDDWDVATKKPILANL
ncbi:hypothetical protein POX_d05622 [Penicillium oxalicum]|uniref:NADP-dependent oxidoreductase domain-containing protein n=1 Tax=Penicillium oxalicum (strain 114-2 / CGMCC 5302) TaxID=933388 RepID=S8B0D1_PENO1|nr:hypothetical protein POX_d05622 [Penicillium oxalicum]EPS32213.1 hypothetical protein PDE_07173 [Penicillium oxalicum 114-2]KAI2790117.1 hypothetical protein POX_d05622 [Penicillium oxalicum]